MPKTRKIKFFYYINIVATLSLPLYKDGIEISKFSHRKGGIVKTNGFVLKWGLHPGPNLDASLTSINTKTFIKSEKLQKHI